MFGNLSETSFSSGQSHTVSDGNVNFEAGGGVAHSFNYIPHTTAFLVYAYC